MASPIRIIVKGVSNHGDDAPTVEDLLSQIQDHVEILQEVEGSIANDRQLIWRVTDVSKNSPITFEITPYSIDYGVNIENRASTVVKAAAQGLSNFVNGNERPIHFTNKVLKKFERLSKRLTGGLSGTKVDFSNYEDAPDFDINELQARKTLSKILTFQKPDSKPHRELGSIEGYIKTIGRDGYGRPVVNIITRLDKTEVKCISSASGLHKIGHLEVGKVIQGLRVRFHGMLFYKSPAILDYIDVERTELFDSDAKLPKLFDLVDPNFTDGEDSVKYIKRMRADV